jgi:integrase
MMSGLSSDVIMTNQNLPYLQRTISRHGKIVFYVRKRPFDRIRINGKYLSPEFMCEYFAAIAKVTCSNNIHETTKNKEPSKSLAWLIERYRESYEFRNNLAEETRIGRDRILRKIKDDSGLRPFNSFKQADFEASMEKRKDKPNEGNNFLRTVKGLFKWAAEKNHLEEDPTVNIKKFKIADTEGFHTWTEEEVLQFQNYWPIGTRERLAMGVIISTGLRRGDACVLGRQHIRNNTIKIKTHKTGAIVELPLVKSLSALIEATPTGNLTLVSRVDGLPYTKESFGSFFGDACKAAGVPGRAHGLRKIAAIRLAYNGASTPQLNAVFGWSDKGAMALKYIEAANKARFARQALLGLEVAMDLADGDVLGVDLHTLPNIKEN